MLMDVIKFIGATRQAACVVAGADPLLFHGCNYWLGRIRVPDAFLVFFFFLTFPSTSFVFVKSSVRVREVTGVLTGFHAPPPGGKQMASIGGVR